MVMLHIKIKENHECSNVVANILPADPPPPPTHPSLWMGSVGKKIVFFSVHGHVTYQIKEITNAAIFCPQTSWALWMGSIGQNSTF